MTAEMKKGIISLYKNGIINTMDPFVKLAQSVPQIEARIGYRFANPELLQLAFVHRSYLNENRDVFRHNERLEFLGDAVLGLMVADYLYRNYPSIPEGELSFMRSRLVDATACGQYVQELEFEHFLLLGRGERLHGSKGRLSILADFFEALIGAIYLDGGLQATHHFFFDNFSKTIARILEAPSQNWKAILQDICQKLYQQAPTYTVVEAVGPEHSKTFTIAVAMGSRALGQGRGSSKKEAQQEAARLALEALKARYGGAITCQ